MIISLTFLGDWLGFPIIIMPILYIQIYGLGFYYGFIIFLSALAYTNLDLNQKRKDQLCDFCQIQEFVKQRINIYMDPDHQSSHNSLSQNLNGLQQEPNRIIEEEIELVNYNQKIDQIHQVIAKLSEEEEILKQTLKVKERELLDTFKQLDIRKKAMRDFVIKQINRDQIELDIGLSQEFQELRNVVEYQKRQIEQLRQQISKQGLGGRNNDQQFIKMIFKIQQMQNQIEVGKKFASTQYVRDYLEKPQIYKVAYEQVKYQFQIRARIKQTLQQQKQHYLRKKQQIFKAITRQKEIQQQLLQQKDNLLKQLKSLS